MKNNEILNKYIDKKKEYLELLMSSSLSREVKDYEQLKEVEEKAKIAEMEMLSIARTFIEGFITG